MRKMPISQRWLGVAQRLLLAKIALVQIFMGGLMHDVLP